VLVKPQFELQREDIGKGGIVRDPALHQRACDKIEHFIRSHADLEWRGLVESSIQGTDGNREFLAWFPEAVITRAGRSSADTSTAGSAKE